MEEIYLVQVGRDTQLLILGFIIQYNEGKGGSMIEWLPRHAAPIRKLNWPISGAAVAG